MMGERTVAQEALFYGFSMERHVPASHLLRLSTASSICLVLGLICALSTARSGGPRLIRN